VKEIGGTGGYRRVRADYEDFRADMEPPAKFHLNRERLVSYLKPYLEARSMPMNTDVLKGLSDATLVTSLCMLCPFDPREKQALLEAADMGERAAALEKLLQMGIFDTDGSTDAPKQ
ncbi:MAG: peptidase S16, partial [Rhodospirillaceae bacterium]|nr:peptidase S16 [Rhodospirillaceae bacterium]